MSSSSEHDSVHTTLEDSLGPSAKVWPAYVSETEKQDRKLAQDCQRDMDAILIFTGLFSASLTAFIIESYRNLKPDSGDATVHLLQQVSHQLLNLTDPSPTFHTSSLSDVPFRPPGSAVICNLLWFLSLGFSLACALTATLAEQWARNYLQATEHSSIPSERARVRAYLYQGIERFKLRTVVDLIPMLLHTSLFLFFAGLVLFLIPVNRPLAVVTFTFLAFSIALYTWCTVLPVVYSDCPYRTPLSPWCWRALDMLRKHRYRRLPCNDSFHRPASMAQMSASDAIRKSTDREKRDLVVLSLTVQALDTSDRLVQFVNHHNPSSPVDNRHLTAMLLHTDLSTRLARILKTSGLYHPDETAQRIPAMLKAIGIVAEVWTYNHYRGIDNIGHVLCGANLLADLCSSVVIDNSDRILRRNTSFRVVWLLLSELIALVKELNELLVEIVKFGHGGSPLVTAANLFSNLGQLQTRMTTMCLELTTLCDYLEAGHLKPLLAHYPSLTEIASVRPVYENVMRVLQPSSHCPPPCRTATRFALEQSQLLHASLADCELYLLLDSLEIYSSANVSEGRINWERCVAQLARCPTSARAQERLLFVLMKYNKELAVVCPRKNSKEVHPSVLLRGLIRDPGLIKATPDAWNAESKLVLVRGGHIVRYG